MKNRLSIFDVSIIWDNASWHKSQEVKDFLISETGKRIWVANTPPYSPEFNPSELIWANLKRGQIANACAKNITQLKNIVAKGMDFIAQKIALMKAFWFSDKFCGRHIKCLSW